MTGTFNLADLFEAVVDVAEARPAIVTPTRRLTYAELDERSNRMAHHLANHGVTAGDHVSLLLKNGTEYLEAMLATFKLQAVPININYRYVERELAHLFENSDSVAIVLDHEYLPRVERVLGQCPSVRHLVVTHVSDDGLPGNAVAYEAALAESSADRPDGSRRSGDDLYIAYTGGTTGMPKGVMWRHEDIFFAALGGGDPTQLEGPIRSPDQLVSRIPEVGGIQMMTPPLMHVSAHWGALQTLYGGGTVVLLSPGRFDAAEALATVAAEGVMILVLVGDAMARPLADAIEEANGAYDLSSLFVVASGGAMLSSTVKNALRAHLPAIVVVDGYGSSETGVAGSQTTMGDAAAEGPSFTMSADTTVLDDDLRPVEPGSGGIGRLARQGHVPLGYYKDDEKSAASFVVLDGVRWVLPGDMATPEADGTITLLGRGSVSINTGGEKVFPEEVESCLKSHHAIYDAVVVGVDDPTWGQRVAAVVSLRPDADVDLEQVQNHCRRHLAGYKVPRQLDVVEEISRNPNGKADYQWARAVASS